MNAPAPSRGQTAPSRADTPGGEQRSGRFARWVVPYIAVVVSITAIVQGLAVRSDQDVLVEAAVEACERNNDLRRSVTKQLKDDLDQVNSGIFEDFFSQVPPDQLDAVVRQERRELESAIEVTRPVDCEAAYAEER